VPSVCTVRKNMRPLIAGVMIVALWSIEAVQPDVVLVAEFVQKFCLMGELHIETHNALSFPNYVTVLAFAISTFACLNSFAV
jgi:hypothetical protein